MPKFAATNYNPLLLTTTMHPSAMSYHTNPPLSPSPSPPPPPSPSSSPSPYPQLPTDSRGGACMRAV